MKTKQRFLFTLFMAIVMMAMSPMKMWATSTAKAVFNGSNTLTFYYDETDHSSEGTVYSLNTGYNYPGWSNTCAIKITTVVFDESFKDARPTTCYGWFWNFTKLSTIKNLSYLNTSEVTNMSQMFYFCFELTSLDLSSFNTAKVTNMSSMFTSSKKLPTITFSSNFATNNVTNMSEMFSGCHALSSLDLSNFNTANVTNMSCMFEYCTSLTLLNLSYFNTANVTNVSFMFRGSNKLQRIVVGNNFTTDKASSTYGSQKMFNDCTSLVGGAGTTYNSGVINKAYARVDGGSSSPGYFTHIDNIRFLGNRNAGDIASFDITPDADAIYTFTANNENATIVIYEKDGMTTPMSGMNGTSKRALAAGTTYTVRIENNTETTLPDVYIIFSKQAINYFTLTTTESTTIGNMAAGADAYCKFTPAETGYYSFTASNESTKMMVGTGSVFNPTPVSYGQNSCAGVLEAGTTYLVLLRNDAEAAITDVTLTTAKVEIPALTIGTNSNIAIPACTTNSATIATFTPTKTGTYRLVIAPSDVYIMVNTGTPISGSTPGEYEVELEAGKMYPVMAYSQDATAATITISKIIPTVTFDTGLLKTELGKINGKFAEHEVTFTLTFANSNEGLSVVKDDENNEVNLNVDGTIKLYLNGECDYVVASTKADAIIMAPDCYQLFANLTQLASLTFDNFNTSNVTNMSEMFYGCSALGSLDLSGFNTLNVTDMKEMFSGCGNIESLIIDNFDMSSLDLSAGGNEDMFSDCENLNTLTMKSLPYLDSTFEDQFSSEEGDKTVNVVLDDNSVIYIPTEEKSNNLPEATNVTYKRNFTNTTYNALYLPFAMQSADWSDKADVYRLLNIFEFDNDDNGTVDEWVLRVVKLKDGESTKANTPYVIKPKQTGDMELTPSIVNLADAQEKSIWCASTDYKFVFKGSYAQKAIDTDSYFFLSNTGGLQYAASPATLKPQRWYMGIYDKDTDALVAPSTFNSSVAPAKAIRIVADDEATGIEAVNSERVMVNNGKFIESGRIVIVKNGMKYNVNGQMIK